MIYSFGCSPLLSIFNISILGSKLTRHLIKTFFNVSVEPVLNVKLYRLLQIFLQKMLPNLTIHQDIRRILDGCLTCYSTTIVEKNWELIDTQLSNHCLSDKWLTTNLSSCEQTIVIINFIFNSSHLNKYRILRSTAFILAIVFVS